MIEAGCCSSSRTSGTWWREDDAYADLTRTVRQFLAAPAMRTSAAATRGAPSPAGAARPACGWRSKIPTSKATRSCSRPRGAPDASGAGTLHYATQVSSGPPSFVVFGARTSRPDPSAIHRKPAPGGVPSRGVPITVRTVPGDADREQLHSDSNGTWRSLVAHRSGGPGVAGSSPAVPTDGRTW